MNVSSLLLILATLAAPPEFTAQLSDGQQVAGQLVELSANRIVLETPSGRRDLHGQITELRSLKPIEAKRPPLQVDLWDASSLAAETYRTLGKQALVTLAGGRKVAFGQNLVASVRFEDQSGDRARQWNEILRGGRTDDVLVVRKQESLDALSGVIGDVGNETVPFTLGDELIQVKLAKVAGIVYANPADARSLPPAFCTLSDASGTRLAARQVVIADGRAQVSTPAGLELELPLDRLEQIRFGQYLSDLAPERMVYTPLLGSSQTTKSDRTFFAPRLNRALEPGGLRLGDRVYAKGLAMYSRSEVVFRLPGAFGRLRALAGIDDAVRPGGNVRLSIYGDNRLLLEEVITGHDEPRKLDVDIRGVARLKIVADFNGDEVADHLDLCEARILE